jgi:ribosomal protein S24E
MEFQEALLIAVLGGGYNDYKALENQFALAEMVGAMDEEEVVEYIKDNLGMENLNFNMVMYELMYDIKRRVAEIIEDEYEDGREIANKLIETDDYELFINYSDSWFGLDSLDYPKNTRDEIIEAVYKEVKADMKE